MGSTGGSLDNLGNLWDLSLGLIKGIFRRGELSLKSKWLERNK